MEIEDLEVVLVGVNAIALCRDCVGCCVDLVRCTTVMFGLMNGLVFLFMIIEFETNLNPSKVSHIGTPTYMHEKKVYHI